MAYKPYFIHGDKVAISMGVDKGNALPIMITEESCYSEFGFILPLDIGSFNIVRELRDEINRDSVLINVCGLINKSGDIYQFVGMSPDSKSSGRIKGLTLLPRTTEILFRSHNGVMEERIQLLILMGYNTIEKILKALGKHTALDVKHYKFFSLKAIVKELNNRKTLSNPEQILNENIKPTK